MLLWHIRNRGGHPYRHPCGKQTASIWSKIHLLEASPGLHILADIRIWTSCTHATSGLEWPASYGEGTDSKSHTDIHILDYTYTDLYIFLYIYIYILNTKISRTQSKKILETEILEYRIHILNIYQRVLLERRARKLRDWCSQPLCDSISRNRVAICRSCYRSSGEASGEHFSSSFTSRTLGTLIQLCTITQEWS